MSLKEKSYLIKIPVYITEIVEDAEDLFGGLTLLEMEHFIEENVKKFNEDKPKVFFENRNKSKRTVIEHIKIKKQNYDSSAGFLLKISAYTTNLLDGYFEANEKINFEKDNKIGSENNFVFIFPVIKGIERNKYQHYYVVLIYEDPNKLNDDLIKVTKHTLHKIFGIPIRNIKLPTLIEEIRSFKRTQELQLKFVTVYNDDNEVDLKYREYLTDGKIKKQKIETYRNIPSQYVEEIIMSEDFGEFDKMETKIIQGKKEYKITKDHLREAKDFLNETAEKVFNASSAISEAELISIYEDDFIISKILPVLENYLSSSDDAI